MSSGFMSLGAASRSTRADLRATHRDGISVERASRTKRTV